MSETQDVCGQPATAMAAGACAAGGSLYGVLAEFDTPASLFHACEQVRDAGYRHWDAHSPFPVHGLDRAMGLKPSRLGWLAFLGAMCGAAGGMTLQWWTSTIDYPLVIAGKPFFSWQAFVPVTFELAVLCGALATLLGMLHFNRLPRWHHSLFHSKRFERVTDDTFFISVEARDPHFDMARTTAMLLAAGARLVEPVSL